MITIDNFGDIVASHKYRYSNEKELQKCLEELFIAKNIPFEREVRLSNKDIVDFVVELDIGRIGVEIKIDGARNSLLRQISRYLGHESITAVFVIGSPYWLNNLPIQLNDKGIYRYRILTGIF
ncbi:hypothetical protein [Acinetobacter gandensis]|uniref:hypothetical protein n=1 Tax=Acinetobacter gandensis TaxID=1443941 RepID=UPI0039894E00